MLTTVSHLELIESILKKDIKFQSTNNIKETNQYSAPGGKSTGSGGITRAVLSLLLKHNYFEIALWHHSNINTLKYSHIK